MILLSFATKSSASSSLPVTPLQSCSAMLSSIWPATRTSGPNCGRQRSKSTRKVDVRISKVSHRLPPRHLRDAPSTRVLRPLYTHSHPRYHPPPRRRQRRTITYISEAGHDHLEQRLGNASRHRHPFRCLRIQTRTLGWQAATIGIRSFLR